MHEKAHAKLDGFKSLKWNWDSYRGLEIDPAIIAAAHKLLRNLPADITDSPVGVPCSSGNVQFEWDEGGRSLELEIETPETIHYFWQDKATGKDDEGTYPIVDLARTLELIRWVLEKGACGPLAQR